MANDMAVLPTAVAVCSETDPDVVYQVQLPYCPCRDYRYRHANLGALLAGGNLEKLLCKHLRTAIERAAGWHGEPEPAVYANISRAAALTDLALADVSDALAAIALREAVFGSPSTIPALPGKRGEIRIEVVNRAAPRRYTLTLHPVR